MMATLARPDVALLLASSAALLVVGARRTDASHIEAGESDVIGSLTLAALTDRAENLLNILTEQGANVTEAQAVENVAAFLFMLRQAEGTEAGGDPYRTCYGYRHQVQSLAEHPAVSGEWAGERLPDAMCRAAGFSPGCVSTAAGAYQIIRPTWKRIRASLGLPDFGPRSQDAAAIELIRSRGALADVQAGRVRVAVNKCRNEWASLPGNYAGQGQRAIGNLLANYASAGGQVA